MFIFIEFDIVVLLLMAAMTLLMVKKKTEQSKKYELTTFFTIIIYRVTTYLYLALGGNFGSHDNNNSVFDHKFIGIIIVGLILFCWPKKKQEYYKYILLGLGTGMIIDEISEVLGLLGLPFPPGFRDSFPDLILIATTFVLFITIRKIFSYKNLTK